MVHVACTTDRQEKRVAYTKFLSGNLRTGNHFENLGTDEKVTLKYIIKNEVCMCGLNLTGYRQRAGMGSCKYNRSFRFNTDLEFLDQASNFQLCNMNPVLKTDSS